MRSSVDINWTKIKIETTISDHMLEAGNQMELIPGFPTSVLIIIEADGDSGPQVRRHIIIFVYYRL